MMKSTIRNTGAKKEPSDEAIKKFTAIYLDMLKAQDKSLNKKT